jgi:hypothetical protein|nr:MAG TPA: hypothetical protein [Caudoviricetes sp.]
MKELKDLVVGDDVLIIGRSYRRIAKIDKVTKTQIVVDNARFRRDSGWQCGRDRWNVRSISVPTEKEISDVKEENLRKTLIYAISSFDFKRLSTDELKQVYNIVKGKENEKE